MNGIQNLQKTFNRLKIKKQLYLIYTLAILLPIIVIGTFLIGNTSKLLINYHRDLIESDNLRIKTIFFEITSQIYNISEEISFDTRLTDMLTTNHDNPEAFLARSYEYTTTENYIKNYAEIEEIKIYTNNPTVLSSKQIVPESEEVAATQWYQKAISQSSVIWTPVEIQDKYGNHYWNLCLVRKIPLTDSDYHAVLMIKISDNYLRSRMDTNNYHTLASLDEGIVFYSSQHELYGEEQIIPIDYNETYYQYTGPFFSDALNDAHLKYLVSVTTLPVYRSSSRIYVCNMNQYAYHNINNIILVCLLIILLAVLLPGILIHFFADYFTHRVKVLRDEMHKASQEDYDIINTFYGEDELTEAYHDLQIMVQNIKKKDAKMYESQINEQKFKNEQQVMEFKMLSSQINPHFLYNTLETIRMKALTAGNREVANAIQLLGKSMRYVLENTGAASTTLKQELDYVEIYLTIQKLRFQDRINYFIEIEEDLNLSSYEIFPLLLQPVVENSILHGLKEVEKGGIIGIKITTERDELLEIQIKDNGHGMTPEELKILHGKINTPNQNLSSNIGLYNINQRIRLFYGEEYGLQIQSSEEGGTTITIILPLINIESE